jgi:uncharacterized protein involved in type VI secretion and phage assembly
MTEISGTSDAGVSAAADTSIAQGLQTTSVDSGGLVVEGDGETEAQTAQQEQQEDFLNRIRDKFTLSEDGKIMLKYLVDEQEELVDFDEEIKVRQTDRSALKRYTEATKMKKEAQEIVQNWEREREDVETKIVQIAKNPETLYMFLRQMGADPEKVAASILDYDHYEKTMTPAERQLRELQQQQRMQQYEYQMQQQQMEQENRRRVEVGIDFAVEALGYKSLSDKQRDYISAWVQDSVNLILQGRMAAPTSDPKEFYKVLTQKAYEDMPARERRAEPTKEEILAMVERDEQLKLELLKKATAKAQNAEPAATERPRGPDGKFAPKEKVHEKPTLYRRGLVTY